MALDGSNIRATYEIWHSSLTVDPSCGTPWHRLLREHLRTDRDLLGKRVLDIGCGRGDFSCWLARQSSRPAEIVAADFAATALRKGRDHSSRLGLSGITWEEQDIQAITHPDGSFDTVFSCETIEHVPNPRRALRELARVLKPGGRLLLTTPNYLGVYGLYRIYLRLRGRRYAEMGQPINNVMTLPVTTFWIRETGLQIIIVDAIGHYLLWPGTLPTELPAFNEPRFLMRWFGLHSLVVAEKPSAPCKRLRRVAEVGR